MESYNLNTTYFRLNQTNKVFPKFKFTKDNIPVGDSVTMCINVHWALAERGNNYDIMKSVSGFPNCTQAQTGKFIWNDDDPTTGVDVPVWIQHSFDADCSDEECDAFCADKYNGFFVNGAKKHICYSYDILDGICVVIGYDKVKDEYSYQGGCFEGGSVYTMKPATMNEIYYFSGIEIEVRDKADPIIVAAELSDHSYSFGNFWRYIAIFLNIILVLTLIALAYIIYDIYKTKSSIKNTKLMSGEEKHEDNIEGEDA